jgi:hypothetical protein
LRAHRHAYEHQSAGMRSTNTTCPRGGVAPDPANRNQFFLLRFSRRISVSLRRSRKETAIKQSGVYDARRLSLSSALPVEIADSAIADGQQIFLSTVQYATNLSQSAEQRASRAKKCSAKQRQTTTKMLLGSCLLMKKRELLAKQFSPQHC